MKYLAVIFWLCVCSSVYAGPLQKPPMPSDYPANNLFTGTPAVPVLTNPEARRFRTRIREAASRGPNFAGHYTIGTWGCGMGCVFWVIIDARTGVVWFPPFVITDSTETSDPFLAGHSMDYEVNSELIIANGTINGKGAGTFYYRWHNGVLEHVYTVHH